VGEFFEICVVVNLRLLHLAYIVVMHWVFGQTVQHFVNESGRALRDLSCGKFTFTLPCKNIGDALGFQTLLMKLVELLKICVVVILRLLYLA
jgi:hypothetical protein